MILKRLEKLESQLETCASCKQNIDDDKTFWAVMSEAGESPENYEAKFACKLHEVRCPVCGTKQRSIKLSAAIKAERGNIEKMAERINEENRQPYRDEWERWLAYMQMIYDEYRQFYGEIYDKAFLVTSHAREFDWIRENIASAPFRPV